MSFGHCPWISVWHIHLTTVISFCKPHLRCYNCLQNIADQKDESLRDWCLRRTVFQSKLKLLDKSPRLSISEIHKVCKQLTYATCMVPDACSQVSWVLRSWREDNVSWFLNFFICLIFSWIVIFHNATGRLRKGLVPVKVIKKRQYDPSDLISFSCFP